MERNRNGRAVPEILGSRLFALRFFQIVVLKRRRHAIDFRFSDVMLSRFVPPCRNRFPDLGGNGFRLVLFQFEILAHAHRQG